MAVERTLSIIKPDAMAKGVAGHIIQTFLDNGITVKAIKMMHLTRAQTQGFYYVHKERPFFASLCEFMTSGPVILMCLEGENVIKRNRDLMGPTNSEQAPPDTLRGRFGTNIERNACHGSDAPETAAFELGYFFAELEMVG